MIFSYKNDVFLYHAFIIPSKYYRERKSEPLSVKKFGASSESWPRRTVKELKNGKFTFYLTPTWKRNTKCPDFLTHLYISTLIGQIHPVESLTVQYNKSLRRWNRNNTSCELNLSIWETTSILAIESMPNCMNKSIRQNLNNSQLYRLYIL